MRTESRDGAPSPTSIPIEGLQPVEVSAALDGETVLIDLRSEPDQLTEGIPGAIETSSPQLMAWAAGTWIDSPFALEKDRRIIVYSSDDSESRRVAESLRDMGFVRVAYLIGGLDSWTRRQKAKTASSDAKEPRGG